MSELRARLEDADYVHSQLQAVMRERDGLQATVREARAAQAAGERMSRQKAIPSYAIMKSLHHKMCSGPSST